jgi:hypothetical protein
MIDGILAEDKGRPVKQRHTSKRIFERLRDEHGYLGGLTIVKDYVLSQRQRQREMFVPLRHDPGHAQADFGEALAVIGGVERKIHFFAMDLPHSDAGFVQVLLSWGRIVARSGIDAEVSDESVRLGKLEFHHLGSFSFGLGGSVWIGSPGLPIGDLLFGTDFVSIVAVIVWRRWAGWPWSTVISWRSPAH